VSDNNLTRVEIRPWSENDLSLLERLLGDPAMTEHLGGPESPEKLRERHQRYCQLSASGKGHMFVIVLKSSQAPVGSVGYWEKEWQGQTVWEAGWSVLPEFQGQGLGVAGTLAVIEHAKKEGKHRFLHAFPSVENGPSNSICRKAGFTMAGASEFEYPKGRFMLCNDWYIDLQSEPSSAPEVHKN
jgi:RimJ/RimL family protein N-acetyltransferase